MFYFNDSRSETNIMRNMSDVTTDGITTSEMVHRDMINITPEIVDKMITNETATTLNIPDEDVKPIISHEVYLVFNTVTNYMMYPLCIVGVVFCIFAVIVYMTKTMRCASSIYLVALNTTELVNVCITLISETLRLNYGNSFFESYFPLSFSVYGFTYLGVSMRRCSYCLSCILSMERLIAIVFPLRSRQFKLVRYPVITVVIIFLVIPTFHVFIFLKLKLISYQADTMETKWAVAFSEMYHSDKYNHDNWSQSSKAIFVYMVLTGCLVCNLLVVVSLKRQSKIRKDLMGSQGTTMSMKEKRTTLIVIASTCTLVFLALPGNLISSIITQPTARNMNLFYVVLRVGTICELISNCCGFVFYITLSAQFRKTFIDIFCSSCTKSVMKSTTSEMIGNSLDGSNASNLTASQTL